MNREREEAIKNIKEHCYFANLIPQAKEALDMAIEALKQEPSEDAISRQAVNEIINDIRDCISVDGYWAIIERVKKLPPVTPQPKTGHWIIHEKHRECSKCTVWLPKDMPRNSFCPNCGCRMVGPQERNSEE